MNKFHLPSIKSKPIMNHLSTLSPLLYSTHTWLNEPSLAMRVLLLVHEWDLDVLVKHILFYIRCMAYLHCSCSAGVQLIEFFSRLNKSLAFVLANVLGEGWVGWCLGRGMSWMVYEENVNEKFRIRNLSLILKKNEKLLMPYLDFDALFLT